MSDLYSGFLRMNAQFGNKRVYALAGMSYGNALATPPGSLAAIKSNHTNKSFGLGIELHGNDEIGFDLELVRYFDNKAFTVDAFNLGLVTHF